MMTMVVENVFLNVSDSKYTMRRVDWRDAKSTVLTDEEAVYWEEVSFRYGRRGDRFMFLAACVSCLLVSLVVDAPFSLLSWVPLPFALVFLVVAVWCSVEERAALDLAAWSRGEGDSR